MDHPHPHPRLHIGELIAESLVDDARRIIISTCRFIIISISISTCRSSSFPLLPPPSFAIVLAATLTLPRPWCAVSVDAIKMMMMMTVRVRGVAATTAPSCGVHQHQQHGPKALPRWGLQGCFIE